VYYRKGLEKKNDGGPNLLSEQSKNLGSRSVVAENIGKRNEERKQKRKCGISPVFRLASIEIPPIHVERGSYRKETPRGYPGEYRSLIKLM